MSISFIASHSGCASYNTSDTSSSSNLDITVSSQAWGGNPDSSLKNDVMVAQTNVQNSTLVAFLAEGANSSTIIEYQLTCIWDYMGTLQGASKHDINVMNNFNQLLNQNHFLSASDFTPNSGE
jgi:hypothetical protein